MQHFLEAKKLECFREYEQMHPRKLQQEDVAEEEIVSENKIAFEERKQWNKEIKKSEVKIEKLRRWNVIGTKDRGGRGKNGRRRD